MAIGLEVLDANSKVLFNSSYNTTRILGNFDTGNTNGSRTIPDSEINGSRLWYIVNYTNNNMSLTNDYVAIIYPIISISGNVISWEFNVNTYGFLIFPDASDEPKVHKLSVNVLYGVY